MKKLLSSILATTLAVFAAAARSAAQTTASPGQSGVVVPQAGGAAPGFTDASWFFQTINAQMDALAAPSKAAGIARGLSNYQPLGLVSALTIAEAARHPDRLPQVSARLRRIDPALGDLTAQRLRFTVESVLSGNPAAWSRFDRAVRNMPQLETRIRASPGTGQILDHLFDGAVPSDESPVQAWPAEQTKTAVAEAARRLRRRMKFGFEPTFLDRRMDKLYGRRNEDAFDRYRDVQGLRLLKELKMELGPTTKTVGWGFRDRVGKWHVGEDPGVIELQPPPQRLKTILPQMKALFRASSKVGLTPELAFGGVYGGGGHIHLDKGIFAKNPLLLRNFLVDVHNRPYLQAVLEELGDDQAQSIRKRGEGFLFRSAISQIDEAWTRTGGRLSWNETLKYLQQLFGYTRFRDVNLQNLLYHGYYDPPTVEIRMHRAQRAPEDFRDLAEFWLYRLANLSLIKKPIPILDLDEDSLRRMRLPSVARRLWRNLVQDSRLPRPERYERFARERFPSPLLLGPARHPRVEIRYARPHGTNGAVYEILVKDPAIRELRMGPGLKRVRLFDAPELPGRPRIGVFVHHAAKDIVPVRGVPGVKEADLSRARKEITSHRALRWRKVR